MTHEQQQQLAAIRERHEANIAFSIECCKIAGLQGEHDPRFRSYPGPRGETIDFLLALLADAERRADEIEHDSDILLGYEWQRSVKATNGDPEAAREHRIAALVADLEEANERAVEAKFSPLGDNHHNAEKCPYCAPKRAEALQQAADARQAEIVAWLRMQADRGDKHIDEHGLDRHTHPSTVQAISTMRTTADAIERGEFRGKGGGDATAAS